MTPFISKSCLFVAVALVLTRPSVSGEGLPVHDSLVGYYVANDLLKTLKAGDRVTSWPGVEGAPLTADGNVGPVLVDSSETGLTTAAVRFTPPERAKDDPVDFRLGEYLNIPQVLDEGQLASEVTFVLAGSRLKNAGLFDTNFGQDPTFRHLGFIQFTDKTCGAGIEKPTEGFTEEAPIILTVVISREPDGLATLTTYVDGEETASVKQSARHEGVPMEPFVGVRFAPPQNNEGVVRPGACLGHAGEVFGNSDIFAFAMFSRALTPQEVLKLSTYLSKKLDIE